MVLRGISGRIIFFKASPDSAKQPPQSRNCCRLRRPLGTETDRGPEDVRQSVAAWVAYAARLASGDAPNALHYEEILRSIQRCMKARPGAVARSPRGSGLHLLAWPPKRRRMRESAPRDQDASSGKILCTIACASPSVIVLCRAAQSSSSCQRLASTDLAR